MNRILALACAAAVVGAAAAVGTATRSADPIEAPARSADVVSAPTATLSCPESPGSKQTETSLLAVAPVGADDEDGGAGAVSVLAKDATSELGALTTRGVPALLDLTPADRPSAMVTASAGLAPGLSASQWSRAQKKAGSGLAVSGCGTPSDDWWFAGVSTSVGAVSRLVLSNPTPAVAEVDLTFYGPDGVVDAVGERDIAIASFGRQSLDLARFAPGVDALAVNVAAQSGRVVAAVRTDLVDGTTPAGTEWIPPSTPPADDIVINAGFAGDETEQQLQLANPSDRQALVSVQVIDKDGPFAPTQLQDVSIDPGQVITKKLTSVTETPRPRSKSRRACRCSAR